MILIPFILLIFSNLSFGSNQIVITKSEGDKYEPNWGSLDKRPLPTWYDEAKVGIFIHWGVFSVPSYGSEWFWHSWNSGSSQYVDFMKKNYPPHFTYQDFGKDFTAEFFDPDEWAELFQKSGAKYVVLTSKHHEGFVMYPSEYSFSWNAWDLGPHRDLVGDLATSIRNKTKIHFGLYHSLFEWFNPMFLGDKAANYSRNNYVVRKAIPEMMELVNKYKPEVFWSDGDGDGSPEYWQSKEFLTWLYNESPVKDSVVVNDRWGLHTSCQHGGYYSCSDRYNPGKLQIHKWENAMTIDKSSWGFRRNAPLKDYLTSYELIKTLVETVSCGGNILVNVGPTKEGIINPIFQERLLDMGKWLSLNGEGIYNTTPWKYQNDTLNSNVWYTSGKKTVYAIVLKWPPNNNLILGSTFDLFKKNPKMIVSLLENQQKLTWKITNNTVLINMANKILTKNDWAWVVKITNFEGFAFEY